MLSIFFLQDFREDFLKFPLGFSTFFFNLWKKKMEACLEFKIKINYILAKKHSS
jgi:hypothetical protein